MSNKLDDDQADELRRALRGGRTLADVDPAELSYVAQAMEEIAEQLNQSFAWDFFGGAPVAARGKVIEGEYTVVRPLLPAGNEEGTVDGG